MFTCSFVTGFTVTTFCHYFSLDDDCEFVIVSLYNKQWHFEANTNEVSSESRFGTWWLHRLKLFFPWDLNLRPCEWVFESFSQTCWNAFVDIYACYVIAECMIVYCKLGNVCVRPFLGVNGKGFKELSNKKSK